MSLRRCPTTNGIVVLICLSFIEKKIIHGRVKTWNFSSIRYLTIEHSKVRYHVYHVNILVKKVDFIYT